MGRPGRIAIACLAAATLVAAAASWAGAPPERAATQAYRMEDYRAPVPERLAGARVIGTREAERIWRAGKGVFVDVMPRAPRPANLPEGTIWRDPPRRNIPGSLWLVDTGYGALSRAMEAYFRDGLDRLGAFREGEGGPPLLVFYCEAQCWMSWNAAKRALALGARRVAWYPDGTDGWAEARLPLEAAEPEPRPD